MTENRIAGMILIIVAGVLQGTFMVPIKYTKRWAWENTWLVFSVTAYLACPWLVAFLTVPHLFDVLAHTSGAALARTFLWGLGWGLGALTFGLGVDYLGLALGFAVIIGLTAGIGTLVPLLVLSPDKVASRQGALIIAGIVVTLVGIAVCSWAGKLRDKARASEQSSRKSYAVGLLLCVLSGLLCPCGNLGFAFGSEMARVAAQWGAAPQYVTNPIWAVLTLPLLICNSVFCAYLLVRRGTLKHYILPGSTWGFPLAVSMGAMWLAGMILYGMGANELGTIGSSIGWAIVMSLMVLVANLWGLITGEWREAGPRPRRIMAAGLTLLVAAMFIVGSGIR